MISRTIEEALNKQINRELYSAYLYLAMSAYFETANMKGFAKWMRIQAKEEQTHAFKFYDYIIARGGKNEFTRSRGAQIQVDISRQGFRGSICPRAEGYRFYQLSCRTGNQRERPCDV
jgi:ferritin